MSYKVKSFQFEQDGPKLDIDRNPDLLVTVTYSNGQYSADKTYAEIIAAYLNEDTIGLKTNYGTILTITNLGQDNVEFSGLVDTGDVYYGVTYRIDASGVTCTSCPVSNFTIELESSGNYYVPVDSSITLAKINELAQSNSAVSIRVNSVKYPYVFGSQLDATFGQVDPATQKYIKFSATGNTNFTRSEIDIGGSSDAVLYTEQFLTIQQKAQARANIGATDSTSGIADDIKVALLDVVAHIGAWSDAHGQDYYDALEAAFYPLDSISAVFNPGANVIYNTDPLESLRQYLTVTADYGDGNPKTVTSYTLSGTLTVGTSTITVTYGVKTDTFTVTVSDMMVNDILTLDGIQNTRAGHSSSTTTWEDLSENQNDFSAMIGSTPSWGTNYAAFDATNRAFKCVADLQGSGSNFTLEFVLVNDGDGSLHPSSTSYQGMVISNCPDWGDAAGQMRFYSYRDPSSNGISCRYGATSLGYTSGLASIKHIAYVFNGSTCVRYVNGEAAGTVNVTYPAGTKSTTWTIGASVSTIQPGYFNGKIFRVGISAVAMTAYEIAERFAFFKTRFSIPV